MMIKMARSIRGSRRRWLSGFLLTAIAGALSGCGDRDTVDVGKLNFYPAKGKVTLPDGKPMTSGRVVFVGAKNSVTSPASIESDGTFTFKGGAREGLPEGPYKVRIEVGDAHAKKKASLPFAAKFLDEDASGLEFTVKPDGPNEFDVKLATK